MIELDALYDAFLAHQDIHKLPDRSGDAWAWCPWHPDKGSDKPNLSINMKKHIVKCFSCGEHGHLKLAKSWNIEVPSLNGRNRKAPDAGYTISEAQQLLYDYYRLVETTIDHFGIAANPKRSAPDKLTTGAWTYPVAPGTRFKAFDRTAKMKYWWGRKADKEKIRTTLYGIEDIQKGTETVYIVNGEPAVWVCWQAGIPAVCAFGEANLQEDSLKQLVDLDVKSVRIILDLDNAGEQASARNVALVQKAGLAASAAQLPSALGESADVCDLYLWHRADDGLFREAVLDLPDRALPSSDVLEGTRFFQRDGRFYRRQHNRDGPSDVPLTNFTAWATDEILVDDGLDQSRHVMVAGKLDTGSSLPEVRVPASKVHNLDWMATEWGYRPIIHSGRGNKDDVREIMQRTSLANGMKRRTIYSHTGWRQIGKSWRFLMPGGAVGAEGVEVELADSYKRYSLPSEPENVKEAVNASLRFLDVGEKSVTLPMLAFAYLAPLQSILTPAFSLWVRASTGSFKSTLTALQMCHFGDFQYNTPPTTWEATPNAIGRYLFDVKDALAWVDDFNPRTSERDMRIQYSKADTVLRSIGNSQGRGRMRADLQRAKDFPPRAMLVSTGEVFPSGASVIARTLAVDYRRFDVDKSQLTRAQGEAELYPHAMAGYILWLADQYGKLRTELPNHYRERRAKLTAGLDGEHARTPGSVAALQIALDLLADFAVSVGARSRKEMEALTDEAAETFRELAMQQASLLVQEDVVDRWLNAMDSMLAQGSAVFHEKGTNKAAPYGTDLLGWFDAESVYFLSADTYQSVAKWYRAGGREFGASEMTLRAALDERGFLQRDEGDKHRLTRLSVNGRTHRVLKVELVKVPFSDYFSKSMFG